MVEWTDYAIKLTEQLGIKGPRLSKPIGESFTESDLDKFSDEQIVQLHELYNETVGTKSTHNGNS
ncbi:UNVERIFIED_CONTAM: hypothetical protein GTU68_000099 [Idotea baltica]|nr:hypothetical protein [Idotea baltica]